MFADSDRQADASSLWPGVCGLPGKRARKIYMPGCARCHSTALRASSVHHGRRKEERNSEDDVSKRRKAPPRQEPEHPRPGGSERHAIRALDRVYAAAVSNLTGGHSPAALTLAAVDWWTHLAAAPGMRMSLVEKGARKASRLATQIATANNPDTSPAVEPLPGENRFRHEAWQRPPFSIWAKAFLLNQQWWHAATHDVPGVTLHHEEVVPAG